MIIHKLKQNHKLLLASFAIFTAASNYASNPTSNGFHIPSLPGGLGLAPQYQLAIAASARNMSPQDQIDIYNTFMDQAESGLSSGNLASTVDALQSALTINQQQGLTDFFNQSRFDINNLMRSGLDLKTIGLSIGLSDSDATTFAQGRYTSPYQNNSLSPAPPTEDQAVTAYENAASTANFDQAIIDAKNGKFDGLQALRTEIIDLSKEDLETAETMKDIYNEQLAENGIDYTDPRVSIDL